MPIYTQTRNPTSGPELTGKITLQDLWEGIMEKEKGGPEQPHTSLFFLNIN